MALCVYRICPYIAWLSLVLLSVTNAEENGSDPLIEMLPSPTHHECIHDEVAIPMNQLSRSHVLHRGGLRATPSEFGASKRQAIRFHANFLFEYACVSVNQAVSTFQGGNFVHCTEDDILTTRKARVLRDLVKDALEFLSKAILVDRVEAFTAEANVCSYLQSPFLSLENVDYLVHVTANPARSSSIAAAWARACHLDAFTLRPIVGHINFAPSTIKTYYSNLDKHVALHELTHALGFTDIATQVKVFKDAGGTIREGSAQVYRERLGKHVTIIKTPKLLEVARKHFGCPTLDGVEVEEGGGHSTIGSHWKKRILYEEVLVGVVTSAKLYYSSFTLAFLEDLGYYTIDYSMAEDDLLWGRNKSCRFLYNKCNDQIDNVDEYCYDEGGFFSSGSCTHDRMGIGTCDITQHKYNLPSHYQYFSKENRGGLLAEMDYCPSVTVFSNRNCVLEQQFDLMNIYGHEFTPNSRCFESNMITGVLPNLVYGARCFPMTCTIAGQILIRVQGQTVPCPANGKPGYADTSRLKGIHGKIHCPDSKTMCLGIDGGGFSRVPDANATTQKTPSSVVHSPLDFRVVHPTSCAERVKCAEKLNLWYPTCRLTSQKILECFGTDCALERKRWLQTSRWPEKCADRKAFAEECLDGWVGVIEICAVASASRSTTPIIPMIFVSILGLIYVM